MFIILEEKLGFDSQVATVRSRENDSVLIYKLKNWIDSECPDKKEPSWENLIWLLVEFDQTKLADQLRVYLTSAPVSNKDEASNPKNG